MEYNIKFLAKVIFITVFINSLYAKKVKIFYNKPITINPIKNIKLQKYSFSVKNRKIKPFYISKYEMSVKKYMSYLQKSHQVKKFNKLLEMELEENEPITNINFYEAKKVCQFFGGRLPSEFEWVVAASVKVNKSNCYEHLKYGKFYNFAIVEFPLKDNSTISKCLMKNSEEFEIDLVGSELNSVEDSLENLNATYGMFGNVWEWVDEEVKYMNRSYKIIKGGSFSNKNSRVFFDSRLSNFVKPETKMSNIGFRCVWDILK